MNTISRKFAIFLITAFILISLIFGLVVHVLESDRQHANLPALIGLFCSALFCILFILDRLVFIWVFRPIWHLKSAMEAVRKDGKTCQISIPADEIGVLATSFYAMAEDLEKIRSDFQDEKERHASCAGDLQRADADLEDLNRELESIVSARTEQLKRAKEEAEIASKAKSEFLAAVSHEIRTPMNAIIGLTNATLKTELATKQRDHLNQVLSSGEGLLTIINDILDLSTIESGKTSLEMSDFSLASVMENVETQFSKKVSEKGIFLTVSLDPEIPAVMTGDPRQLGKIMGHLVGNAVKFTEYGGIVIKAGLKEIISDRICIEFSVEDTGVGIRKEQLPTLFSAFTQGDGSPSRRYGGAGLGLTVSKHLVELMNGRIWAESEPETGSVFFFTAEFRLSDVEFLPEPHLPPRTKEGREKARPLDGTRLLLADDSTIDLQIVAEILKDAGSTVVTVSTGTDAVSAVKDGSFDAVLMDVEMPEMNGTEAAELIRKWETDENAGPDTPHKKIPIVALTAHDVKEERKRILSSGMNSVLAKPVDNEKLVAVLAKWIGFMKKTPQPHFEKKNGTDHREIPGIDMKSGVERLRGNADLYKQLLTEFHTNYELVAETIRAHIEKGDMEAARKLAHTVKGMAGNLSAHGVQKSAFALETAIREGKTAEIGEALIGFGHSLAEAFESIKSLGLAQPEDRSEIANGSESPVSRMQDVLSELDDLIQKRNPDAETYLQSVRACFGKDAIDLLAELERQLGRFDFRNARHTLNKITSMSHLRIPAKKTW